MKRVALYTTNPLLHKRISLILNRIAEVDMIPGGSAIGYSLSIVDRESFPDMEGGFSLPFETRGDRIVNLPILHTMITGLVDEGLTDSRSLMLDHESRTATVSGRAVRLTDTESRLLSEIMAHPSFVSKEHLLSHVFGDGKDIGIVNVYVHYLREKLESGGEKIIISSRKEGYKINEKYRGDYKYADAY